MFKDEFKFKLTLTLTQNANPNLCVRKNEEKCNFGGYGSGYDELYG